MNIDQLDWSRIQEGLNAKGFATIGELVDIKQCDELIALWGKAELYRKKVVMERHRFGMGEYQYFNYPLPRIIQQLREEIYPYLVAIANRWMQVLRTDVQYPDSHESFLQQCHDKGQKQATPLILKYEKGGYNTLHQDLYGEVSFPLQLVLFLSEYEQDYEGGEFVITEQVPRAQSKVNVIKPKKGDALLFATSYRPVKGVKGYYRANLKHGVSEVSSGGRLTLGIIFHDATN